MNPSEASWKTVALCSLSALAGMVFVAACGPGPRSAGAGGTGGTGGDCVSLEVGWFPQFGACVPSLAGRSITMTADGVPGTILTFDDRGRVTFGVHGMGEGGYTVVYDDDAEQMIVSNSPYGEEVVFDYSSSDG